MFDDRKGNLNVKERRNLKHAGVQDVGYCSLKIVGLRFHFSRIIIMKFASPWQRIYCGVDGQHRWVIWPQALADHSYWWEISSSNSSWNTNLWPAIMLQRSAVIWNYSPIVLLFSGVTFNKHWAIILISITYRLIS